MSWVVWPEEWQARRVLGGKARALAELMDAGFDVPPWFVVPPQAFYASLSDEVEEGLVRAAREGAAEPVELTFRVVGEAAADLRVALARLCPDGAPVAVRSSAAEEDGSEHSFAGQFVSHLDVPADEREVRLAVAKVWASAYGERVRTYRAERGLDPVPRAPAAIIQRMLRPTAAGVAFSADPASGRRGVAVVSAVPGLADAMVSGRTDADTWKIDRDRVILERTPTAGGGLGCLSDEAVIAVAELARAAEAHFGRPQDIEWAYADSRLWLLQSRPITAIAGMFDPDGEWVIWDNSNISESYGGATTAMTFSFARGAYAEVYREFCALLGVPAESIAANDGTFARMLGFIRNRIYYNLPSWYRVLALLPGFESNRAFMEQMMGVREALPAELLESVRPPVRAGFGARMRDRWRLLAAARGLARQHRRLPRSVSDFHARVQRALSAPPVPLQRMRPDELAAHYRTLERELLRRWDAPLVNDFLTMIFCGVLRKLCTRWCRDRTGALANALLAAQGDLLSAEPVVRMRELAVIAARDPALRDGLGRVPYQRLRPAIRANAEFREAFDAYLLRFGERCMEELKLESLPLSQEPGPLLATVGMLARSGSTVPGPDRPLAARPARDRALRAIGWRPFRRMIFQWVLRNARAGVHTREALRFERTRVFGRVRSIVLELGRRLHAARVFADPREVFHLEIGELLGFVEGTAASADLRALAAVRAREFERNRREPEPPAPRFETRGMALHGHRYRARPVAGSAEPGADADVRRGTGSSAGIVRGRVRRVIDPGGAGIEPGEILVAERTDPGWVLLFPVAAGLIVERGSLLSHASILARELGLPAVVGLPGAMGWLQTGDTVEIDGATGEVRRFPDPVFP
jgi:phosphohistidine swiveling domain-containing protein